MELREGPLGLLSSAEICFNAADDNDNRLIDEGCDVRQGLFHVALAWSERETDFDLLVMGPDGEVAEAVSLTHAGLTSSGDCPSVDRSCPDHPYESVHSAEDELVGGTYWVRVRLNSVPSEVTLRDVPERARLGVRTPEGTTNYVVLFRDAPAELRLKFELAAAPTEQPVSGAKASKASREQASPAVSRK